jgi:hypothetical protein
MAYIIKNTSGLVNTRVTDTGRKKLSQGNFKIAYFQIGDSEVSYDKLPTNYNYTNSFVLEPPFNTQNSAGVPESNRQSIKYPYYVDGSSGSTYGIPYMDSVVEPVYNRAPLRGFFTGNTTASTIVWSALTNDQYVVSSNYVVDMSTLVGSNKVELIYSGCNYTNINKPSIGDIITIYYDGFGEYDCNCVNLPTPTPSVTPTVTPTPSSTSTPISETCIIMTELDELLTTEDGDFLIWGDCVDVVPTPSLSQTPTQTPTPTPTPSITPNYDICASPTPTPTPTRTPCLTPTPSRLCPAPPPPSCVVSMNSCYQILTYKIVDVCENTITLDRNTPDFCGTVISHCYARTLIYPPNMTSIYDSITPNPHWGEQVIDFESICDTDQFDVKIWNMNIPWTENPAGLIPTKYEGYEYFGSIDYVGSKEYFGYNSSSGQTFFINNTLSAETTDTFYYNSLGEIVNVKPEEQKAIAIIHYTNQTIDFFYGEKFALEPYDPSNPDDTTGQARNFKVHIPWLMWHKNPDCCFGQTFWVDPPGFEGKNLFQVRYVQTTKNDDMNNPGIRYYHLWDTNKNKNGLPNRIGKVFPDSKLIIIDDEEIIAAMSYKSNRNWTLPAPQLSLITPNTCGQSSLNADGVLTGHGETMYVTYRFTNKTCGTNSLHCNYYVKLVGNNNDCTPNVSQNVAIRFGKEFNCLDNIVPPSTTTTTTYYPSTTTTTTLMFNECFILSENNSSILTENLNYLNYCNDILTTTTTYLPITTTTTCPQTCDITKGYFAESFQIICQKVITGQRPDPSKWKIIDYTSDLGNFVTQDSLTNNTFVITKDQYEKASYYNLGNYINLTKLGNDKPDLNFGDEYYFYGSFESDIMATIYEMKYKINLNFTEFQNTTNPTWTPGAKSYVTEIALLDEDKDILVMSKLQSPVLRQGIQQYVVKIDF